MSCASAQSPGFTTLILRPATVCGYSPRLRLDLSVNILTNHAINRGKITVFGGQQLRPNFHVRDCAELYVKCLALPEEQIAGKTFNAGYQNLKLMDIAELVRKVVGAQVAIETTPTNDNRSYHISSEKIRRELGYEPRLHHRGRNSRAERGFYRRENSRSAEQSVLL